MNNLNDITIDKNYNSLLGYTQIELENYFEQHIEKMRNSENFERGQLLEQIKKWYNGYNFGGCETLYNPFSILLLFNKFEFQNYWYETGTPTFLVNLLYQKNYDLSKLEELELLSTTFGKFDIENIGVEALLFQTGYLTIKSKQNTERGTMYKLYYPNLEIKNSLLDCLFKTYIHEENGKPDAKYLEMENQLKNEDIDGFFDNIKYLFSGIPNVMFVKKEAYYSSIIYALLAIVGINAKFEEMSNIGRLDCAIQLYDKVYIFEFKLNQPAENALQQIKEKKYADKFGAVKKILVGAEICDEIRNIKNYVFEKID